MAHALDDPVQSLPGHEMPARPARVRRPVSWLAIGAVAVAILIALPVIGVLAQIFEPSTTGWARMAETVLPRYIANTAWLAIGTGIGVAIIGTGTAWLVAMCRFPGRRFFEWALILPLAVPAYVIAYAYTDFLQHPGPVQTLLRDVTGWGPRDYWFPNIRSLEGAIAMFTLVLYPYVYLLARNAFLEQSVCVLQAGRTLGQSAWGAFWRVALPLARPAIAAGVALALMETLADFGAVHHFGVQTFTVGIYRAWLSLHDAVLAAQLAASLLGIVALILLLERLTRGRARYHHTTGRYRPLPGHLLRGWRAWLATLACALPVFLGFALPGAILLAMAFTGGHDLFGARYLELTANSFTLAGLTAILAVAIALFLTYAQRLSGTRTVSAANRIAGLGYAVPGAIIAVGILIPLAAFDNALDRWLDAAFGISTGLLLTGTIFGLVYAYLVRFMAVALQTVDASLAKVTPGMDAAARSLGESARGAMARVHGPMVSGGLLTAGLIVFVDVMKELPATLILRPFNFDTLAVQAYRLAADERLTEASTAALVIVAVGLLPVIVLSRTIMRARPGARRKKADGKAAP
jgi:iron(III) transport system permease protein